MHVSPLHNCTLRLQLLGGSSSCLKMALAPSQIPTMSPLVCCPLTFPAGLKKQLASAQRSWLCVLFVLQPLPPPPPLLLC
jgi:hypothetical protein